MKWLITGGCGFIGRNLIRHLLKNDEQHSIRVLDNLSVGTRADLERVAPSYEELSLGGDEIEESLEDGGVQLVEKDVLDADGAQKAATGIDVIVHLAANTGVAPSVEDPRHDCETNVIGTLNMLEAARHQDVSRFVLASSGAPIGECDLPIHEEMAPHPKSPYGASKLAGEGYCSAYYGSFDIETVALRFGNVYGPLSSHKSSVVAKFIRRARDGKVLEIYGDGHQTRDYIFTEDLVRAIRLAASTPGVGGELFQIATNSETSVNELVDALVPVLREAGIEDVEVTNTEPRVGDVRRNYSDTSKAQSMLGWEAQMDLTEGLRRTVQDLVEVRPKSWTGDPTKTEQRC